MNIIHNVPIRIPPTKTIATMRGVEERHFILKLNGKKFCKYLNLKRSTISSAYVSLKGMLQLILLIKKYLWIYGIKKTLNFKTKYSVLIKVRGFRLDSFYTIICYHVDHKFEQLSVSYHFITTLYRAHIEITHFSQILIRL